MGTYNGVWQHLFEKCISRRAISSERTQLLPSDDEGINYQTNSSSETVSRETQPVA